MRVLILATLVLSAALAGCADRADAISARDGLGPAREAAAAHGSDPVLIGIASIEPFKHMAEDDAEVWIHLDKNPGDGLAPGWMYTFVSGDRHIGILYAAGLGVIAEGYESAEDIGSEPLQDWVLDSPAVARILAKLEDWPAASDDTTAFWDLRQTDHGPIWHVEWSNATASVAAMVDARNGNVTHIEQVEVWMDAAVDPGACEQAFASGGTVSPLQDQDLSLDVADGGFLEYSFQWSMTVGEATMTISGPDGEVDRTSLSGNGHAVDVLDGLEGGTYTLAIEAGLGMGQVSALSMWSCG